MWSQRKNSIENEVLTIKEKKGEGRTREEIKDEKKIILEKMEIIIQPGIKFSARFPHFVEG